MGSALVEEVIAESLARDEGRMEVFSSSEALGFYWKLGFRIELSANVRTRKTTLLVHYLLENIDESKVAKDDPSITESYEYDEVESILVRKLGKAVVDVFEDVKKMPPSLISGKIVKRMKRAESEGTELDTSELDCVDMYLPEESLAIWKEVIHHPEKQQDNLKKLREVAQPGTTLCVAGGTPPAT